MIKKARRRESIARGIAAWFLSGLMTGRVEAWRKWYRFGRPIQRWMLWVEIQKYGTKKEKRLKRITFLKHNLFGEVD